MTLHPFLNVLKTAVFIASMAIIMGASYLLDEAELTPAQIDAIQMLKAERKRDQAARELCVAEYGPQAAHHWDAEGSLVCITARGETLRTAGL